MNFFSPSKVALINVAAWPDCVEVSDEVYKDLQAKLSARTHTLGEQDGQPVAIPVPVVEETVESVFNSQLVTLNLEYENVVTGLRSSYPLSEAISWADQVREAREILADPEVEGTAFIDALHASRQAGGIEETKSELAQKVVGLHAILTPMIATVTGNRHVAERALEIAKEEGADKVKLVAWNLRAGLPA